MTRWHNYYLDNHPHFCTATVSDWKPLLIGDSVKILYEEWESARRLHTVRVFAYVIMPNHYHVVLWAEQGDNISKYLRRTQSITARRIQPSGGLWKERPRVLPLNTQQVLKTKVDYLHRNPLRAGLVTSPENWEHSSFRQLVLGVPDERFACDDWGLTSF